MDAGNIVYIIAIIIYFIYTALKKSKGPEEIEGPEKQEQERPRRPTSFDDMLKEIREGQKERKGDFDQTGQGDVLEKSPERRERSIEKNPERRDRSIEKPKSTPSYQPRDIDQPKAFKNFQGEVSEGEKPRHKTLDEQVRLDADIEGLKSTIAVEELDKPKTTGKYKSLLRSPESVKEAIILSEILNRKNF